MNALCPRDGQRPRVSTDGPQRQLDARFEPVHVHGVDDTSLHLVLDPARGAELVNLGWAEPHQYEDWGTEFLVYGPRDDGELAVVVDIVRESIAWATGRDGAGS